MADNAITNHGQSQDASAGDAVGRVNLKRPPTPDVPPLDTGESRGVTPRDLILGVIAIIVMVLGLIVILQAAYQMTPT